MPRTRRTNCLFWAARRLWALQLAWLRAGAPRGREPHVWLRSSQLAPWWVPTFGVEHWDGQRWAREKWVPDDSAPLRWWQTWRKFWFAGHVETSYRGEDEKT